ncbi:UNVERIFIED_CONTAM: hypothetical protein PYX00_011745 [Menopon gallinae]|uniref:Uncharacterized protein n=1 Tax=Menopon gallinae TaxID=328185 RepID=A0AAW2H930_9NEOP
MALGEMSEIYTVDISSEQRLIACGGRDDSWAVLSIDTGETVFLKERYSDSVIFARFVGDGIIVATLDGCIYKYNRDFSDKCRIELGQDISFIEIKDQVLYAATDLVYLFSLDLELQSTACHHASGVTHVAVENGILYTISETLMQASCCRSGSALFSVWVNGGGAMCVSKSGLLCAQTDSMELSIFLGSKLLRKIELDDNVEAIACFHNNFLVGGYFNYLLIISTNASFCMQKVRFDEEVGGVSKIHIMDDGAVIFSTLDGKIDDTFLLLGGEHGVCVMLVQDILADVA